MFLFFGVYAIFRVSMALTREGSVYMWGNFSVSEKNGFEFGENEFTKYPYKVTIPDVSPIVSIAIGI